jgi:hypothetical protein
MFLQCSDKIFASFSCFNGQVTLIILLHTRFPGEHDLCIVLHFHGNVTVLFRNSEFVTFPW